MTMEIEIRAETRAFRTEVESWSESTLRAEGLERGIPGCDTAPLSTVREAIIQHERDQLRTAAQGAPELPERPGPARKGVNRLNR